MRVHPVIHNYSYGWLIGALFIGSIVGQWVFGWYDFGRDQEMHHALIYTSDYVYHMLNTTLENWQSEFLQLLCQVGLLTWLIFRGSPQSKDQQERMERKLDAVEAMVTNIRQDQILTMRTATPPSYPPTSPPYPPTV
jgi:uncharacterized protein DUF6766